MANLSYMNKMLQAASCRADPYDYEAMAVLMAIQNLMRNAKRQFQGRLWCRVHQMMVRDEINIERAELELALRRLQQRGIISLKMMVAEGSEDYWMMHASFTAKGLRKLRATDWGQYPEVRKEAASV